MSQRIKVLLCSFAAWGCQALALPSRERAPTSSEPGASDPGPPDPRYAVLLEILASRTPEATQPTETARMLLARWDERWNAACQESLPAPSEWAARLLVRGLVTGRQEELQALLLRHDFESVPAALRAQLTRADAQALAGALRANASLRPVEIKVRAPEDSPPDCEVVLVDGSAKLPLASVPGHTVEIACVRRQRVSALRKIEIPLGRELEIVTFPADVAAERVVAAPAATTPPNATPPSAIPALTETPGQSASQVSSLQMDFVLACAAHPNTWLGLATRHNSLSPACLLGFGLGRGSASASVDLGLLLFPHSPTGAAAAESMSAAAHIRPGLRFRSPGLVLESARFDLSLGASWSLLWSGLGAFPQRAPAPTVDLCGGIARTMWDSGSARVDACTLFRVDKLSRWGPALRFSWSPN